MKSKFRKVRPNFRISVAPLPTTIS